MTLLWVSSMRCWQALSGGTAREIPALLAETPPGETRLIRFGRFARRDSRRFDGKRKPETFNFLEFYSRVWSEPGREVSGPPHPYEAAPERASTPREIWRLRLRNKR
jgi:hypothetical protein